MGASEKVAATFHGSPLQEVVAKFLAERDNVVRALQNCPTDEISDYWRWQGHAEARRVLSQNLAREGVDLTADATAAIKADALREAAQAQRQLAADARTGNGKAEHEDRADWLDDRANAIGGPVDPIKVAIDVIARALTEQMLDPMDLGDMWDDYPEIGEDDWRAVVARARDRVEADKPDTETYRAAYALLQGRAEAWAAEDDPA